MDNTFLFCNSASLIPGSGSIEFIWKNRAEQNNHWIKPIFVENEEYNKFIEEAKALSEQLNYDFSDLSSSEKVIVLRYLKAASMSSSLYVIGYITQNKEIVKDLIGWPAMRLAWDNNFNKSSLYVYEQNIQKWMVYDKEQNCFIEYDDSIPPRPEKNWFGLGSSKSNNTIAKEVIFSLFK